MWGTEEDFAQNQLASVRTAGGVYQKLNGLVWELREEALTLVCGERKSMCLNACYPVDSAAAQYWHRVTLVDCSLICARMTDEGRLLLDDVRRVKSRRCCVQN